MNKPFAIALFVAMFVAPVAVQTAINLLGESRRKAMTADIAVAALALAAAAGYSMWCYDQYQEWRNDLFGSCIGIGFVILLVSTIANVGIIHDDRSRGE